MTDRAPMPRFLKLVRLAGAVLGTLVTVGCVAFLVAAGMGAGPYSVNGAPASKAEFMAFAAPLLGSYVLLAMTLIAVSWGLRHGRPWSRLLLLFLAGAAMVFGVTAGALVGVPVRQVLIAIVSGAIVVASLWWYLYREDDVIDYYDDLEERVREARDRAEQP